MHAATRYNSIVYYLNLIKEYAGMRKGSISNMLFFHLLSSSLLTCQRKCQYFDLKHVFCYFSTRTDKVSCNIGCSKFSESSSINRGLSDSVFKKCQKKILTGIFSNKIHRWF